MFFESTAKTGLKDIGKNNLIKKQYKLCYLFKE